MGVKDVAGISRAGVFERIDLPTARASVAPQRGTAVRINFRASGPDATATPTYDGPNVSSPQHQEYVAQAKGAVAQVAPMWDMPAPMSSRRRRAR